MTISFNCKDCKFFCPRSDHGNCSTGECRRYAPKYMGAHRTHWCMVSTSDWCGEFERGKAPQSQTQ